MDISACAPCLDFRIARQPVLPPLNTCVLLPDSPQASPLSISTATFTSDHSLASDLPDAATPADTPRASCSSRRVSFATALHVEIAEDPDWGAAMRAVRLAFNDWIWASRALERARAAFRARVAAEFAPVLDPCLVRQQQHRLDRAAAVIQAAWRGYATRRAGSLRTLNRSQRAARAGPDMALCGCDYATWRARQQDPGQWLARAEQVAGLPRRASPPRRAKQHKRRHGDKRCFYDE